MREAARVMPGGNTRTTSFHPPYPVVIQSGDGPWVCDVDQCRYLDLFCNGLSLIHGHGYAPVREAIVAALQRGMAWSGASREQIAYAEMLRDRLPAIGAYHGSYPDLEAGLYGQGNLQGRALIADFNDLTSFERVMAEHGKEVAALVIEPVLVTGRVVAPQPGFLKEIEQLARRYGALTILDDCLMLRLAVGGSCEKFGLQPDLIVLGKFLGGGTALGAFGGARDLMKIFDPTRPRAVFHGGSFNGNLLGCAAGIATLQGLTRERIEYMDGACERLRSALAVA